MLAAEVLVKKKTAGPVLDVEKARSKQISCNNTTNPFAFTEIPQATGRPFFGGLIRAEVNMPQRSALQLESQQRYLATSRDVRLNIE
jgi:hypothetical protein